MFAGVEPATFRLLVRRATSRATETTGDKTAVTGSRLLGTMAKCQTATDERASQAWSQHAGVPVASV